LQASTVMRACQWSGVLMQTASIVLSARISRKSYTSLGAEPEFVRTVAAALSMAGWYTSQTATT
jgi:hypothetical protein